ncbi:MAG TPA: phosphoribosylanthranilate isomerase [Fodinibius sp.]|nr:phosphoribosylanthranilate isomerase [Fodinibius sp.]
MMKRTAEQTKLKVCGLTSLEDARFVSGALAHYLGFIFYEESPRHITPAKAGAIINWIQGPECVGVFVNQPLDDVNAVARQTGIDYVQLHGNENPEYCQLIEKPVIKVIHINDESTPEELVKGIDAYQEVADFLLFDTKTEDQWGGTGQSFDWKLLDKLTPDIPFFLSGGLTPDNVQSACRSVQSYGIDMSSGLEAEPGIKDFDKVERLMDKMRDIWEKQATNKL